MLNSILLGAAAGALAAILARLIADPKEKKGTYTGALVVLFLLLNQAGRVYILPKLEMRQAESELVEVPAFAALKEHDPETFDRILTQIRKTVGSRGDKQKLIDAIRVEMVKVVQERLPVASDDAVVNYMTATMDEVDELYERGDDLCFRFLFPKPGESLDISKYVSEEAQKADLAALAEVIKTSAEDPQEVPGEADVMPDLQPIVTDLASFHGDDFAMLQNPQGPDVDKRKVCEIATGMYDKIFELSNERSGPLLRYLLAQT